VTDASRLALGGFELTPAEGDLVALARAVVARLDPTAAGRILLDVPPGAVTGTWDLHTLDQVISNLLANAIKYSAPEAPVTVTIRAEEAQVHLDVRDSGIGLTSDEIARLFQRYGRTEEAIRQGIQDLGLGLYLAHAIVQAHGGRIWAESAGRDQGTTLHVTLPRHVPQSPVGSH
jgi:signal transduction histidine kinase